MVFFMNLIMTDIWFLKDLRCLLSKCSTTACNYWCATIKKGSVFVYVSDNKWGNYQTTEENINRRKIAWMHLSRLFSLARQTLIPIQLALIYGYHGTQRKRTFESGMNDFPYTNWNNLMYFYFVIVGMYAYIPPGKK